MSLTSQQIKRIGELARLRIEESEIGNVAGQLDSILSWIDQLQNVDTRDVDGKTLYPNQLMQERQDEVTEPCQVENILANAPSAEHNMFTVPKMVD